MTLTNKAKKEIGALINTLMVAKSMMNEALANENTESFNLWYDAKQEALNTLLNKYGIEV